VTILSPAGRARVPAAASIELSGSAEDDAGRPLHGAHLRWFAGRRALGRGEHVTATPPVGTRRIRLVATDSRGRSATATLRLQVAAAIPHFQVLKAPAKVGRHARSLLLRVSADQPALLRIGAQRFAVGTHIRRIRVRVRPGTKALALPTVLSAHGKRLRGTLRIARA
jgi:hypothetical protein